jgi:hypothetical protein
MPTADSNSFDELETALLHAWEVLRSRTESPDHPMRSAGPLKEHPDPVHTNPDVNQNNLEKSARRVSNRAAALKQGVENPQR